MYCVFSILLLLVFSSLFTPRCEAYKLEKDGTFVIDAVSNENGSRHAMQTAFHREARDIGRRGGRGAGAMPFGLDAIKNITEQVTFADVHGKCDRLSRKWDTAVDSTPAAVKGRVVLEGGVSPLDEGRGRAFFDGVWGIHVATAFVEENYLDCALV